MGSFHFTHLAFLWDSPAAGRALSQILLPVRPFTSVVNWHEMGVCRQPDRDLLWFETRNIAPAADIVDAVNAVDVSALTAAFVRECQRDMAAEQGNDDLTGDEAAQYAWEVSSVDRCLAWLAEQVGGPVSSWDHLGDHGLVLEEFTGYVPSAAWRNREEYQGTDWTTAVPAVLSPRRCGTLVLRRGTLTNVKPSASDGIPRPFDAPFNCPSSSPLKVRRLTHPRTSRSLGGNSGKLS